MFYVIEVYNCMGNVLGFVKPDLSDKTITSDLWKAYRTEDIERAKRVLKLKVNDKTIVNNLFYSICKIG